MKPENAPNSSRGDIMKQFEYDISMHPASDFLQLAYFCSAEGSCNLEEVPGDQVKILSGILKERGKEGWELIQMQFGKDGLMAFWKREL